MCPDEFVSYNKRFLSRIYPGSQREDCSNFNPVEFWNCGSQIGMFIKILLAYCIFLLLDWGLITSISNFKMIEIADNSIAIGCSRDKIKFYRSYKE